MKYRLLALFGFVALVGTLVVLYRNYVTIDLLVEQEKSLRTWLDAHPVLGFLAGFGVYLVVCFVPGTTGKSFVVAWLFGFWQGVIQVNVALTIAAMLTFWLSRYVFREAVLSRSGASLLRIDEAISREGAFYLFSLRVLHSPYSVTNYVMGATSISSFGFWWSTQLGLLPGNIIFIYAGTQIPSIQKISEEGLTSFITPGIIAAFVALSVLPLVMRWAVRKYMPGAEKQNLKQ